MVQPGQLQVAVGMGEVAAAPREVILAALSKGLDGGMSGAAAMTIQVLYSVQVIWSILCNTAQFKLFSYSVILFKAVPREIQFGGKCIV